MLEKRSSILFLLCKKALVRGQSAQCGEKRHSQPVYHFLNVQFFVKLGLELFHQLVLFRGSTLVQHATEVASDFNLLDHLKVSCQLLQRAVGYFRFRFWKAGLCGLGLTL